MKYLSYLFLNIISTLFRLFPFPGKTGLIIIGNPDRISPVFLTGNYRLTLEKVKRSLQGIDCYLLVVNSKGINVWCAATGGHFTNHQVISALKTSDVSNLVDHRNLIVPQLAASGVEAPVIKNKTGWKIIWGPVDAVDIPSFLEKDLVKTDHWRRVKFPIGQRLEMGVAWAFMLSLIFSIIILPLWPDAIIPLIIMVFSIAFLIFSTVPLYHHWLNAKGVGVKLLIRTRFPVILWGVMVVAIFLFSFLLMGFSWSFVLKWLFLSTFVIAALSLDLMGSTPLYKSALHEDRLLEISLDKSKCKGTRICIDVCPKNCFDMNTDQSVVSITRLLDCVQCGACIVQCPFDALFFQSPDGKMIPPQNIRKYKLNLLGQRSIKADKN